MGPHLLLFNATESGDIAVFKRVLEENPGLDINWKNPARYDWTFLHIATSRGHTEVAEILLTQPLIEVNAMGLSGLTALCLACQRGSSDIVRLLCEDPRVDVNLTANKAKYFPLFKAASWNQPQAVKWLIALRGEDLDLEKKASYDGTNWTTPLEIARARGLPQMISLLEKFTVNPALTQCELRVELGLHGSLASQIFALVVFLCDDLLKIKQGEAHTAAGGFFAIATTLPMELQMLLCHRVMRSTKQNIISKDSEYSFKQLAKALGS